MPEVFELKVIRAKKLNVEPFRREIERALAAEGKDVTKEYEKTTKTWKRKPKFETITDVTGNEASVLVGSDDEVYRYVDEGTRIRWALMSADWKSKTTPKKIGSTRGSGRVVIAGRRAMQRRNIRPRPGIKAREFSETIRKQRKNKFTRRMVKAMQKGAKKAF